MKNTSTLEMLISIKGYRIIMIGLGIAATLVAGSRNQVPSPVTDALEVIRICETGIQEQLDFIQSNDSLWGLVEDQGAHALTREEKQNLIQTWTGLLDYFAQLDHIQASDDRLYGVQENERDSERFYVYYLAFLTQYRYALEVLEELEQNSNIHIYLNEAHPESGLDANVYKQFKYHFLNVMLATKFAALYAISLETDPPADFPPLSKIHDAETYLFSMGNHRGTEMTLENGWRMMQDMAFDLWLPLQKGVSTFMAGKKVWRVNQSLLSTTDVHDIENQLKPGDILFTRKEWALTNLGLPGFWTHSALYIGTPAKRLKTLSGESVVAWAQTVNSQVSSFEDLLELTYPAAYAESQAKTQAGNPIQIIEALAPGVILNSLQTTLSCDGVVVLRPRLDDREKANAIYQAFNYLGRPYDLNFDFRTDSALVCSEMVLKSYEPGGKAQGLTMKTIRVGQRVVTPCNLIIQQFCEELDTPDQQLDFILFYDGYEKEGRAIPSSLDVLLESWKRPDWHIFTQ